jgi:hypothetical protein
VPRPGARQRVERGNEADPLIPNVATADGLQIIAAPVTPTVTMAGGRMAMGIAAAFKPAVAGGQTPSDGSP